MTAGALMCLASAVAFGAMGILGRLAYDDGVTVGTLLAVRFVAGLPHGAFFGAASVAAASMVPREKRARAVSRVFLGLTIANVVGVPLGTLVGQDLGWRATFALVGVVGLLAVTAVWAFVPAAGPAAVGGGTLGREVRALRHPQVLLSLGAVVFGFGAMFACYSYVTPLMTEVGGFAPATMTLLLAVVGLGMTAGSVLGGRAADRARAASISLSPVTQARPMKSAAGANMTNHAAKNAGPTMWRTISS
jgi:DHA1 family inner membrane transport protein